MTLSPGKLQDVIADFETDSGKTGKVYKVPAHGRTYPDRGGTIMSGERS
jgi:hypothetical protein